MVGGGAAAGHVDDATSAALDHSGEHEPGAEEGAPEVGLEDFEEFGGGDVLGEGARAGGAGVVDEDVDGAEGASDVAQHGFDGAGVGDVGADGEGVAAGVLDVVGYGLDVGFGAGADGDAGAAAAELEGDGAADAGAGAGDDDDGCCFIGGHGVTSLTSWRRSEARCGLGGTLRSWWVAWGGEVWCAGEGFEPPTLSSED